MPRPRKLAPVLTTSEIRDADAVKASTIYSAAKLDLQGLQAPEIALILGIKTSQVTAALRDPRAQIAMKRLAADQGEGNAAWEATRASHRLAKAWEVLEEELDSGNDWLRHQAALAVIAADAKRQEQAGSKTEIIIAPELAFDDQAGQYLQAPGGDTAITDELTGEIAEAN